MQQENIEISSSCDEDIYANTVSDYIEDAYYRKRKKIFRLLDKMPTYILNYEITTKEIIFSLAPQPVDSVILENMSTIKSIFTKLHQTFLNAHEKTQKKLPRNDRQINKYAVFKGYIEKQLHQSTPRERYWYANEKYPSNKKKKLKTRDFP